MRSFEESKSPELLSRQSTDFLNLRTVEFRTARHSDSSRDEIQSPQYYADLLKTLQTPQQYSVVRQALKSSQNEWMRDFVSHNGFNNLLHTASLVCCPKSLPNDRILSALVACVTAVLERRDGLDAATKGEDTVNKLAMGLVCSDEVVKKDILSLLTSLARHSSTGHRRVLDAFTQLKKLQHLSHRFILLVQDLTTSDSTEYHQALLTCVNCLIDRSLSIQQRTDIRNELIALGLLEVLKRLRNSPNTGVAQQIIRFYDQKSSDDVTSSDGLDVSDPQAMFTILWKKIATTPQSTDLVRILQKLLLTVDDGSDSWGQAEHALTGPRSTEGVFDEKEEEGAEEEKRESSPDVPECPVPQRLHWQTVPDNKCIMRSVWSRVSECKANQGISNLGSYFYRTHPSTNKLLFIESERANRLKLLLATFSGPGVDSIEKLIQYITQGDVEGLGEGVLRLLIKHLPKDPTVIKTIQQYDGDAEELDDAEKLCFALFNLPGNKARLQCMLGSVELPRLIQRLQGVIERYRSLADTLTKEDCPLNELLRLVLDVGNVLNAESPASKGYKLGALRQLYNMRAPRQPSLTLLRYITQILDRAQPDVLQFVSTLSDQLELCIKDDLNEVEACLKEAEVSLRGVRTLLVASNKELKLQFTEFVVEAGKALTELKGSREELKKRVEELAQYYCESPDSFDITQFYTSLHCFTQQVVETHELCKLSTLSCRSPDTPPKLQSSPAPVPEVFPTSPAPISAGISETSEDSFTFGDRMSIEAHLKTIESPPLVAPKLVKRKSFDMQLSYTQRHGTDFQRLHDNFRSVDHGCRSAYETRPYPKQSVTHEMSARPLPPPPDIVPRHQSTVFEPVPVLFEGPPKGRKDLRHSPPTRDDDARDNVQPLGYQSDSSTSDESELEDEYGEAYRDCYYDFPKTRYETRAETRSEPKGETRSETRSMGYSSVNVTLNDPMGNIGGSLRTHQRPPRVDVRDIFNRAHSVSTSDMRTQDQRQRDQIRNAHTELQRNAQHHSIQSMIQRDQNSALSNQRLGGTKRENSRSTPSLSIQQQARNGHTMSNPVNNTSLSPPVALRYQGQTRGGLDRPYSAGSRGGVKLPPFIDETEIIHHERQTSEPTEMRRGGLVRAGKFSSSSSEINKSGVETEV